MNIPVFEFPDTYMTGDATYEQIEAYLTGSLSQEAHSEFEEQLKNDQTLAQKVEEARAALLLLEISAADRLVHQIAHDSEETPVVPLWSQRRLIPLVAAIVALLLLSVPFFYANSQYSNVALATAQYQPYSLSGIRGDQAQDQLMALLAEKRYEEAIPLLQAVPIEDPFYREARMYLGNAFFLSGRMKDAATVFWQVAETSDVRFSKTAEWYVALSMLADNQLKDAKVILTDIAGQQDHAYADDAQTLLMQLESGWRKFVSE